MTTLNLVAIRIFKKLYMVKTCNQVSVMVKMEKNSKYKKYNYKKDEWYE